MAISDFIKDMIVARKLHFGEGEFRLLGVKGYILPAFTVMKAADRVYQSIGDEVFNIVFEVGKAHGKYAIEKNGRQEDLSKREFIVDLVDAANVMGIGKIEVKDFNLQMKKVKVSFNPLTVDVETDIDQAKLGSEFVRGVYHGIGEDIFKGHIDSKVEKIGREQYLITTRASDNG